MTGVTQEKINFYREQLLIIAIFFLPLSQKINHWFFGAFLFLSVISIFRYKAIRKVISENILYISIISVFLLLKVSGLFYDIEFKEGMKGVSKSLPFLLYPLCIISFKRESFDYQRFERRVFYSLVFGCLLAAIICWSNVILSLKANDLPENRLFGWKKSGLYLTEILKIHPPYLGFLLVASIVFLTREIMYRKTKINKIVLAFFILFLFTFLFNITARNSLFFLIGICFLYIIYMKKWKLLLLPAVAIVLINILIINHPSEFYRIKMYQTLGLVKKGKKDERFARLESSWNVFKESPIIGVGPGKDDEKRIIQYELNNDTIAAKKNLNSHNQLFEYLVEFGSIGGLLFIIINGMLLYVLLKHKKYFLFILFGNILFGSLTESIFERVLGIQYYSIVFSLIVLSIIMNEKSQFNKRTSIE